MELNEIIDDLYGPRATEQTRQLANDFSSVTGFDRTALSFLQRAQISKAIELIEKGDQESVSKAKKIIASTLEINPQTIAHFNASQLKDYISNPDRKAYEMKRVAHSLLTNGYKGKIANLYQSGLANKVTEAQHELREFKDKQEKDFEMNGLYGVKLDKAKELNNRSFQDIKAQDIGALVAAYLINLEVDEQLADTGTLGKIKQYHIALQYINALKKRADSNGKINLTPENEALYAYVIKLTGSGKEIDLNDAIARVRIGGLTKDYLAMDERDLHMKLYESTKGNITEYVKASVHGVDNYARLAEKAYLDKKQSQIREVTSRNIAA